MRLRLAASSIVVLALSAACSRGAIAPDDAVDTSPLPPPDLNTLSAYAADPNTVKLGAACSSGSTCGTKGRVAIRSFAKFQRRESSVPCKPAAIPNSDQQFELACVGDGRLYYEGLCDECRLPSTDVVEAEIAELSPQQLSNLQHHLRFAGPLRTASAWRAALASGRRLPARP